MKRAYCVGALAIALLILACGDNDPPTGPTSGSITVNVTSAGEDAPTGYTVVLDGSVTRTVGANGSATFSSVSAGAHEVELTNIPVNCTVTTGNPANAIVNSGDTTTVTMRVTCSEIVDPFEVTYQVSAEGMHTCGLKPDGTAYCWGSNSWGELGDGSLIDRSVPVTIVNPGSVTWASISSGFNHSCGLSASGDAYCWGDNSSGQLGNGNTSSNSAPVAVANPGSGPWTAISAGYFHTCGVTSAGDAYCWGQNRYGELGNGSLSDSSIPVAVTTSVSVTWASIAVGRYHTCGLTTGGEAYCWGENTYSQGALGDGSFASSSVPVAVVNPDAITWASITAGGQHSCGVSTGGEAYCWGNNIDYQLGNIDAASSTVPATIPNPEAVAWASISAGANGSHTCATSTGGELYCWGENSLGQLGRGTTIDSYVPVAVTRPGLARWASVDAGQAHTCGTTTDGDIFCWGYSEYGQLGDGRTVDSSVPVRVLEPGSPPPPNSLPVPTIESPEDGGTFSTSTPIFFTASAQDLEDGNLSGSSLVWTSSLDGHIATDASFYRIGLSEGVHEITLTATDSEGAQGTTSISLSITASPDADSGVWAQMSTGDRFTCGILDNGEGWCWGEGGTLGDGSLTGSSVPVAVINPGSVTWASITSGPGHTCGLSTAGESYCWGNNSHGQLGDGSTSNRSMPVAVIPPGSLTWAFIAAGGYHTCGLASTGEAYCWGENSRGQLGSGNTTSSSTPVAVTNPGFEPWAAIAAGLWHSCGVTTAGDAYCWGENFHGELGDGSWTDSTVPVPVIDPGSTGWARIAAGSSYTCGTATGGDTYCWGRNDRGQLGNGSSQGSNVPVTVTNPGSVTWASLATSGHSCGTTTEGDAYCWGPNNSGELGDGGFWDSADPVAVLNPGSVDWADVAAGGGHSCATTTGGAAYCWGLNEFGQLGNGGVSDSRVALKVVNP